MRSQRFANDVGLTVSQQAEVAETLDNITAGGQSEDTTLSEVFFHISTADEMSEPANYGRKAIDQNNGGVAYPIATLITVTRTTHRPSREMVDRVTQRVEDAMHAAFRIAVSVEVGGDWAGDTMFTPDDQIRGAATDLLSNGLPPTDHECVSLIDANGQTLEVWERQ